MGAFKAQTVVTAAAGRCVRCPLTAFYCFFSPPADIHSHLWSRWCGVGVHLNFMALTSMGELTVRYSAAHKLLLACASCQHAEQSCLTFNRTKHCTARFIRLIERSGTGGSRVWVVLSAIWVRLATGGRKGVPESAPWVLVDGLLLLISTPS
jgi:hypothetical protein